MATFHFSWSLTVKAHNMRVFLFPNLKFFMLLTWGFWFQAWGWDLCKLHMFIRIPITKVFKVLSHPISSHLEFEWLESGLWHYLSTLIIWIITNMCNLHKSKPHPCLEWKKPELGYQKTPCKALKS
jgi:hypothetical protein